jgi:ribosomal protein S18 acetylase RimI-like enzyme
VYGTTKEQRVTNTPNDGIFRYKGLAAAELAEVRELGLASEQHDELDLRLSWSALAEGAPYEPTTFLSYRDGALVGFLTLYGLGDDEAEATGVVRPDKRRQGVFRALIDTAAAACREAGTPALVFYADDRSEPARAVAAAVGAERSFAEAKMRLNDSAPLPDASTNLDFHAATLHDATAIGSILARDMDGDQGALQLVVARNMQNPAYRYYIATLDNDPVGTLNIQTIDGEQYIYGFVVRPDYRGRGFGREILARTLRALAGESPAPVLLEVEPDNTPAVNLYRSLGFEKLVTYDYYRLRL